MASLGWLLNLDFAGSESAAAAAGPAVGSLILLGVGRAWPLFVPILWEATTKQAYAGELDVMLENYGPYVDMGFGVSGGALLLYGTQRLRAWWKARQASKLPPEPPPRLGTDPQLPKIVGHLGGPNRQCPWCGHVRDKLYIFSNKVVSCHECSSKARLVVKEPK